MKNQPGSEKGHVRRQSIMTDDTSLVKRCAPMNQKILYRLDEGCTLNFNKSVLDKPNIKSIRIRISSPTSQASQATWLQAPQSIFCTIWQVAFRSRTADLMAR
jgi:hypothetical protein